MLSLLGGTPCPPPPLPLSIFLTQYGCTHTLVCVAPAMHSLLHDIVHSLGTNKSNMSHKTRFPSVRKRDLLASLPQSSEIIPSNVWIFPLSHCTLYVQVLSLPVANLHDSDSGDQYLYHPVHMHCTDVGERCSERLWNPEEPVHPAEKGYSSAAATTTATRSSWAAGQGHDSQTTTGIITWYIIDHCLLVLMQINSLWAFTVLINYTNHSRRVEWCNTWPYHTPLFPFICTIPSH